MNVLSELRSRFATALAKLTDNSHELVEMVRRSQDAKFGDYQANCAMPLAKQLGKPPRDVAAEIVAALKIDDLCHPPEIAGPGFINLKLRDDWLIEQLKVAAASTRLGIEPVKQPQSIVVDYSAPNVAKEMHVGHIRSTVIGDCLYRVLQFLGHRVQGDNHIGDWGTQFGMIIYGYRNFVDQAAYKASPITELARLYRLVSRLVKYQELKQDLPRLVDKIAQRRNALAAADAHAANAPAAKEKNTEAKNLAKQRRKLESGVSEAEEEVAGARQQIASVEEHPEFSVLAASHPNIAKDVLVETAKLHSADAENRRLWEEFLPHCLADIDRIYKRLGVRFDLTLGESFYQDRLAAVVKDLKDKGLAVESEGAVCIFLDGFETPMIVQKQDGAFLYATTDLATIQYRVEQLHTDAAIYVVDHRQSLHFEQLFTVARLWGYDKIRLNHVSFGTVLGEDGRPFKTRSGDTVQLSGLIDEAVQRAHAIVAANDDGKPAGRELSDEERQQVAERIGIAAIKYADLSQNRSSDYVFSYDKMLAMTGNTATYMQYAYARVRSIFAKGQIDVEQLRKSQPAIELSGDAERALAMELLRFGDAIEETLVDYRPNQLTGYLFELANRYSTFFEACPVLKAESDALRQSRLQLCDLTARTLKQGLSLLGIEVVERM